MSEQFQSIEEKVKQLKNQYRAPEDRESLSKLEKELRRKLVEAQICEIPAVQSLIQDTIKQIDNINLLLQYDRELTVEERLRLMDTRKVHMFWVDRLDGKRAKDYIKNIESFVNSQVSNDDTKL